MQAEIKCKWFYGFHCPFYGETRCLKHSRRSKYNEYFNTEERQVRYASYGVRLGSGPQKYLRPKITVITSGLRFSEVKGE